MVADERRLPSCREKRAQITRGGNLDISFTKHEPREIRPAEHVVVFAEAGFSKLDVYGRDQAGLSLEELRSFAGEVNRRGEVGTLHPKAPISAIPRAAIRESSDPERVARFVTELLEALLAHGLAREVLYVDFATPRLAAHAREGTLAALSKWEETHPAEPRRVILVDPD